MLDEEGWGQFQCGDNVFVHLSQLVMVYMVVILSIGYHERKEITLDLDTQCHNQNIWFWLMSEKKFPLISYIV